MQPCCISSRVIRLQCQMCPNNGEVPEITAEGRGLCGRRRSSGSEHQLDGFARQTNTLLVIRFVQNAPRFFASLLPSSQRVAHRCRATE
jgi:hypothetical protein